MSSTHKILLPGLADVLHGEVLLDGRLVGAEHGGPVDSPSNHHRPDAVPDCRVGVQPGHKIRRLYPVSLHHRF